MVTKTQNRLEFAEMITLEEYEQLRNNLEKVGKCDYIPTSAELNEIIKEDIIKYLPFLIWIDMQDLKPLDEEEKNALLMIDDIVLDFENQLQDYWDTHSDTA